MEQPVDIPLHKIGDHEHGQELGPPGPRRNFQRYYVLYSDPSEEIMKRRDSNVRERIVKNEGEQEEVEKHVKAVQPKIFPEDRLVFSPGIKDLQTPDDQ